MDAIHNEAAQRFELTQDGATAVLEYRLSDDVITFYHTGVPSVMEGKGIGSRLVKTGLEYALENGYSVVATCSFVAGYIARHPELGITPKA